MIEEKLRSVEVGVTGPRDPATAVEPNHHRISAVVFRVLAGKTRRVDVQVEAVLNADDFLLVRVNVPLRANIRVILGRAHATPRGSRFRWLRNNRIFIELSFLKR